MTDDAGGSVAVDLEAVGDLRPVLVPADEHRFSLLFAGPVSRPQRQGILHFSHPVMGSVDLFAAPVDRVASVRHYEAIVNGHA